MTLEVLEQKEYTIPELMLEYANSTAKTSLEIFLQEGLTKEDYSMSYQILSEAILYIQRRRD